MTFVLIFIVHIYSLNRDERVGSYKTKRVFSQIFQNRSLALFDIKLVEFWILTPAVVILTRNLILYLGSFWNYCSFLLYRKIGKYVNINGTECLNMASLNFLGMSGRKDIEVTDSFLLKLSFCYFSKLPFYSILMSFRCVCILSSNMSSILSSECISLILSHALLKMNACQFTLLLLFIFHSTFVS